ncbi:MAG: DUF427 domain-containing protein [Pseudomonadota bacterium]
MWKYRGQKRPGFAIEPEPGQESVWDYPRPPAIEACNKTVIVTADTLPIAQSSRAVRILETASPPTVYVPPEDINLETLSAISGSSFCEWKGAASYYSLASGGRAVAWQYRSPAKAFSKIKDYLCFYPGRVDCFLDDEPVKPQAGEFYGGWVTNDIVGPFKGDPGTGGW